MTDAWTSNYDLIRRLYQDQRISLKRLKEVLVEEYGLPDLPISKLERKIRNDLGLRKKLKSGDWKRIYLYAESQGYVHGTYRVFINRTQVDTKKVWKEIRRSGAHKLKHSLKNCSLPPGVKILPGTGSPDTLNEVALPLQIFASRKGDERAGATNEALNPSEVLDQASIETRPRPLIQILPSINVNDDADRIRFFELIHEALPCNNFRRSILAYLRNGQIILYHEAYMGLNLPSGLDGTSVPGLRQMISTQIAGLIYPTSWKQEHSLQSFGESPNQYYWAQQLCILVYIISNQLYGDTHKMFLLFGIILNQLSFSTISTILRPELISLQGLWDALLKTLELRIERAIPTFQNTHQLDIDSILTPFDMVVSLQPQWMAHSGHLPAVIAASLGRPALTKKILTSYTHLHESPEVKNQLLLEAMIRASDAGSFRCIKYLAEYYSQNEEIKDTQEIFAYLLSGLLRYMYDSRFDEAITNNLLSSLEILLEFGADPHVSFNIKGFEERYPMPSTTSLLRQRIRTNLDWKLPILHASFYLSEPAYAVLSANSRAFVNTDKISRIGIFHALQQSNEALDDYMLCLMAYSEREKQDHLEALLLEQFSFLPHPRWGLLNKKHAHIASSLVKYGVDIPFSQLHNGDIDLLFKIYAKSVREYGMSDDLQFIARHLLKGQPESILPLIKESVEYGGSDTLEAIHKAGIWTETDAKSRANALVQAAQAQNYEAVNWLLDRGIDLNSESFIDPVKPNITVLGGLLQSEEATKDMLLHLVKAGAKLRLTNHDEDCFQLIEQVLSTGTCVDLFNVLKKYPMEFEALNDWQWTRIFRGIVVISTKYTTPEQVLVYWQAFGWLFQQYYTPSCGKVLVKAIQGRISRDLVKRMLENGANVNETNGKTTPLLAALERSDFILAQLLIQQHAIVDKDALIEACSSRSNTAQTQREKMDLINILVESGCDINRGNDKNVTPLSAALNSGDLMLAHWLVEKGAVTHGDAFVAACLTTWDATQAQRVKMNLIQFLMSNGSNINEVVNHKTPLSAALEAGDLDLARWLIERGAVSYSDALIQVCSKKCLSVRAQLEKMAQIRFMLENGVPVDTEHWDPFNRYRNPLFACMVVGDIEAASLLLKQHADPNLAFKILPQSSPFFYIRTALDEAVQNGRLDLTQLLLKSGALGGHPGLTGYESAQELAIANGNSAIAKLIRRHVNSNEGFFATHPAGYESHQATIAYARQYWQKAFERYKADGHSCSDETGVISARSLDCECRLGKFSRPLLR